MGLFPSKYERAFANCELKAVTIKANRFLSGQSGPITSAEAKPGEDNCFAGADASLSCPKTSDLETKISSQYSNHPSKLAALRSLQEIAAEAVCRSCQYAGMSPEAYSDVRARELTAEAKRLEAEAKLATAQANLDFIVNGNVTPAVQDQPPETPAT